MLIRAITVVAMLSLPVPVAAQSTEGRTRLQCAGPMCARVTNLRGGNVGIQLTTFPPKTTHINMRCNDGRQQDSRTSTYMFCKGRSASLQHCRKKLFSSSCSPWFIFSYDRVDYNPL